MEPIKTKVFDDLGKKLIKVLSINLTNDTFEVVKALDDELTPKRGYNTKLSEWFLGAAESGVIFFDDITNYLEKTKRDHLIETLDNSKITEYSFCYRRICNGYISWVKLQISKDTNYSKDNRAAILYVVDINDIVSMINSKEEELDAKLHSERENILLNSLSQIYHSIHIIDLDEDSVSEVRSNNRIRSEVNKKVNATSQMIGVMNKLMAGPSLKKALDFTDLQTLRQRMNKKKIITEDLMSTHVGWVRVNFIAVDYNSSDELKRVLFVVRTIDDEKRREESLINISYTDELTSLYNRRAYENDLQNISKKALNPELVVMMFDVNGLKAVNDNLGHRAGDELICAATSKISEKFSTVGRCYRTGGDEFAVIAVSAVDKIDNLIKETMDELGEFKGEYVSSVSVAVGYAAACDNKDVSVEDLEKIADRNMYQAKHEYYINNNLDRRKI